MKRRKGENIYFYKKKRMIIEKNASLQKYNTFGLNYLADCIIHLKSEKEIIAFLKNPEQFKKPHFILGGGSNILLTGDFKGTVIRPEVDRIRVVKEVRNEVIISAGAGVNWDRLVEWCVSRDLSGLENLSLIPGTVGASPVQNIGAYGVEVKELIVGVRTISAEYGSVKTFTNDECEFGYRSSVFKKSIKGKYLVTRVFFRLSKLPVLNLSYGSLKEEVEKLGGTSLRNVRKAVINIRNAKLPDPALIGNAGSFFKNPVVSSIVAESIVKEYPSAPKFNDSSGLTKLAAGWLVDQCGWKGIRNGDAGVHDKQALVLVNHGEASGKDIYELSESIRKSVLDKFGIHLEREVEVLGSI